MKRVMPHYGWMPAVACLFLVGWSDPPAPAAEPMVPTSLSQHADYQRTGTGPVRTWFKNKCCPPQQQPQQQPIVINNPPPAAAPYGAAGPDPTTINLLGQVLSNQGQILNQIGRIQGQQVQPAPIVVNPSPAQPNQPAPIVIAPQQPAPAAPIVYQPQPLPQQYAPQPLPQQYAPQPLPQQYAPQPLPQGYQPSPLPQSYNPQIIVNPGGGGAAPQPQPLPGGYAPQQPLPPGYSPAPTPRGLPYGGQEKQPPGIDFRYYGPSSGPQYYMPPATDRDGCRNGSAAPPAANPQIYTRNRSPRQPPRN